MFTLDFSGKVVLVLGGGTGIGAAIARAFAVAGADVAASYYETDVGAEAVAADVEAAGRRCLLRPVDSRDIAAIERMIDQTVDSFGAIDVLVYNAGLTEPHNIFEITEEEWDRTHDINLKGMFFCARRVAAHMREQPRSGSMVLLSSVQSTQAFLNLAHYGSSKGGVNMLTRSLARHFAPLGIRVNAIAPGTIFTERHRRQNLYDPLQAAKRIPLGRVGTPEDIAHIALFLASDYASFVTGHVLFADGGMTLMPP